MILEYPFLHLLSSPSHRQNLSSDSTCLLTRSSSYNLATSFSREFLDRRDTSPSSSIVLRTDIASASRSFGFAIRSLSLCLSPQQHHPPTTDLYELQRQFRVSSPLCESRTRPVLTFAFLLPHSASKYLPTNSTCTQLSSVLILHGYLPFETRRLED